MLFLWISEAKKHPHTAAQEILVTDTRRLKSVRSLSAAALAAPLLPESALAQRCGVFLKHFSNDATLKPTLKKRLSSD